MKIAFEVPVNHLEDFEEYQDFHFPIANVLEISSKAIDFYRKVSERKTVILDNGVFELGEPRPLETILEIARAINAHVVVAPDFPRELERTLDACYQTFLGIQSKKLNSKIMGVVVGGTFDEWVICFQKYLTIPYVDIIGIPFNPPFYTKFLEEEKSKTRAYMKARLNYLYYLKGSGYLGIKPIHLLGASDPIEYKIAKSLPMVETCDTSSPVVHGMHGIEIGEGGLPCEKIEKKLNFFATLTKEQIELIIKNIKTIKRWLL